MPVEPVVTTGEPGALPAVALPSDGGPEGGLLAGKFTTADELAKGYTNLATLLGKQGKLTDEQVAKVLAYAPPAAPVAAPVAPGAPAVSPAAPAAPQPAASPLQIDPAKAAVESAGLKLEDMNAEFAKDGKLSDASLTSLAKVGISKEVVDGYIAGQSALREQTENKAFASVGGEEKYKQMTAWALTGLKPEEAVAFNAAVIGTPAAQALAISGLKARFEAAVGSDPALIHGDTPGGGGGGYSSNAQIRADMKDPRYRKDPAYRDAVHAKVARSGQLT